MMIAAAAALVSCNMDFYSSDTMTSSMLKENPGAAVYTTDGNYSMFYQHLEYASGMWGGYTYSRLLFLMTELRGDNVCLSGRSEDPLYEDCVYGDNPQTLDLQYFWYASYKIIYGANSNIESIPVGVDAATDHLLGENYFIRAIAHLNLCNIFATPYTYGAEKRPDMPGVVLRNSTDCSVTTRATIGEVYEQIVEDLKKAADLMKAGTRRGNAGYASYNAARGLLTRVYLYMGEYDKCIELAEEMLGGNPASNLDDITKYFSDTRISKETLWCIAKDNDDEGTDYAPKSQLASMYYSPDGIGGTGWCEMYWSDPLMELIFRHPEDKRLTYFGTINATNDGTKVVHWPMSDPDNNFRLNAKVHNVKLGTDPNNLATLSFDGKSYTLKSMEVNGHTEYYINGYYPGDVDDDGFEAGTRVYVRDNVAAATGCRDSFPAYTMSKFSWQDGDSMLSSPAVIRWAEVVLNAAEAYAHKGDVTNALKYTNVIRTRAGIPTWADAAAYEAEGYTDIVDVVLDERRLELCFEGHRAIDVFRNGKVLDRRFAGVQPWEVLDKAQMDLRFPYCIPFAEISVSGIQGNKKQN